MASYSSSEKIIANFLSKFPKLKSTIKKLYSIVNYYIYKKKFTYESDYKTTKVVSSEKCESFFGYYDKSPINQSNTHILFQEVEEISTSQLPDPTKAVNIVLFDIVAKKYQSIATSTAYNWQQGTKLQWLSDTKFIYNDFDGNNYISNIFNIESSSFTTIDHPVYDCFKDQFALSLDFNRLNILDKGYGYKNINTELINNIEDGIFYIDLIKNYSRLIISIENIINLCYKNNMEGATHTFNHIMISPDGNKFIFIHRWYQNCVRYDSLILSNIEGTEIKVLADNDMVSHCCWINNENIVGYLKDPGYGNSFYKINIVSGNIELFSDKLKSFSDGHPSFHGNKMLFDSYPDRSRMQHLFVYDFETDEVEKIGVFLSPLKYFGESRCDLHPKWSNDGKKIFIDSVHNGIRKLFMVDYAL